MTSGGIIQQCCRQRQAALSPTLTRTVVSSQHRSNNRPFSTIVSSSSLVEGRETKLQYPASAVWKQHALARSFPVVETSSAILPPLRWTTTQRFLSTAPQQQNQDPLPPSRYAVVDHSQAYEEAMKGPHGKQLELAHQEGMGKDDLPFDPFAEEEDDDEEEEYDEEYDEDDDYLEAQDSASPYNNDGSLKWKKSQLAAFRAGAPSGGMFAILELAGSQHKVTTDDLLVTHVLKPLDQYKVGSIYTFSDNVLLLGSSHLTLVGMPYVGGAQVDVMVEEITQDAKVIVFKKRRRKNYKRKNGHRRDVMCLRILDIRPPTEWANHEHAQRENPSV